MAEVKSRNIERVSKGRKRSEKKQKNSFDRPLFFIVLLLIVFGVLMVFSASAPYAARTQGDPAYYFKRDIVFASIGILIMLVFSKINFRMYKKFAKPIFAFSIFLCLLVYIPGIGKEINNAKRWIGFGSFTFMPSDISKIASIIFLSAYLSKRPLDENGDFKTLLVFLVVILVTVLPIYFQPNFSAVVVIAASLFFLYILGGMKLKYLLLIILMGLLLGLIVFRPYPGNYRLERLLTVLDPLSDPMGSGWQLLQSLYAVSSGGLFGVGFGQSRQKFDYLADEPHNDFIFAVISEELGFIGAALVILAFVYLAYRILKIAQRTQSSFGRLLAYGIMLLISIQAFTNIGVAIGLIPPTGITLPFISYGGSSLVVMCSLIGILLNISRDRVKE